jgi:hypothetical protein
MSADCDTRPWFFSVGAIKLRAMGRNFAVDSLPHYREVLVANAVSAVRDSFPTVRAFAAGHRAWLAQSAEQASWRAVAIAAASAVTVAQQAVIR